MMDTDINMVPAGEGSSGVGSSSSTPAASTLAKKNKRFEIKKWNALWAWGTVDSHVHPEPTNESVMEGDNTHVYESIVDDDSKKLPDVKGLQASDAPIQNEVTTTKTSYASMVTKPATLASPTHSPSSTADQQPKLPPLLKMPPPEDDVALKTVYIKNLPPNIKRAELVEALKVFGGIKQDGIQLSTFLNGYCYAFVEFESASSAQKAVMAKNITIGEHKPYIFYKRSDSSRTSYNSNGGYRGGPERGSNGAVSRRPYYRNQSECEPRDGFSRARNGGGRGRGRSQGRRAESYNDGGGWNYIRRNDERRLKDGESVSAKEGGDERMMIEEEGGYQRYYQQKVFVR